MIRGEADVVGVASPYHSCNRVVKGQGFQDGSKVGHHGMAWEGGRGEATRTLSPQSHALTLTLLCIKQRCNKRAHPIQDHQTKSTMI